jgi:hypothetical protein
MKLYLIIVLFLSLTFNLSKGQNIAIDNDKSDLLKLKTESLQLEMDVDLYPNPATEFLNVTLNNAQLKNVEIEMYNIIGNKLDFELDRTKLNSYKINVKDLHSGYYLLLVKDPISRYNKAFKFRKH